MKLSDTCPICSKIKEGKFLASSANCCVIQWGVFRVAVLTQHKDYASADTAAEAIDLLGFGDVDLMISDFGESAGHWGLKASTAAPLDDVRLKGE
jgi:hypothetical protein